MYEYISGELKFIYNDYIVIDNGGIGYKIFTSNNTLFNVTVGDFYTIYTDYIVKEDYVALFGFKTMDELSMFKLLVSVNSIGPKVACGILSSMSVDSLKLTIVNGDAVALATAKGVGKKTAQKIILELKDKISIDSISSKDISGMEVSTLDSGKDLEKRELVSDALAIKNRAKYKISKKTIDEIKDYCFSYLPMLTGMEKEAVSELLNEKYNIDEMEIEDIIKLSMKKL